jgi:prepilin-type N-terminal cleavage/methylation domain-containing protein
MKKAFTLIELLIVVAIIAILAAIAVPNFLEAQTRAKVSRVKSDLRTLATGVESYQVDHNKPPAAVQFAGNSNRVIHGGISVNGVAVGSVTSPIAYLSSLPSDPFSTFISATVKGAAPFAYDKPGFGFDSAGTYPNGPFTQKTPLETGFVVQLPTDAAAGLGANGPVTVQSREADATPLRWALWSIGPMNANPARRGSDTALSRFVVDYRYDPTNGTVSPGFVCRYAGATPP